MRILRANGVSIGGFQAVRDSGGASRRFGDERADEGDRSFFLDQFGGDFRRVARGLRRAFRIANRELNPETRIFRQAVAKRQLDSLVDASARGAQGAREREHDAHATGMDGGGRGFIRPASRRRLRALGRIYARGPRSFPRRLFQRGRRRLTRPWRGSGPCRRLHGMGFPRRIHGFGAALLGRRLALALRLGNGCRLPDGRGSLSGRFRGEGRFASRNERRGERGGDDEFPDVFGHFFLAGGPAHTRG